MKVIADLHLHSKFSRATSPKTDLENLAKWARIKGIKVVGTGDFTHPAWLKELKDKLTPAEEGLFRLKLDFEPELPVKISSKKREFTDFGTRFLLTSEVNCVYSKQGKVRKIHILIFAPSFEVVDKIRARLSWIGNLKVDGRPTLRIDSRELAEIVLNICEDCLIVPAHLWTPYYGMLGSKSGFDSIEECFEDYSKYIYAVETGLSCYDEKTEVLTNNGWRKFSDVRTDDKICTLNLDNNQIEFQTPIEKFVYNYQGKMYRLRTKRVDLLVTPNHKLLVASRNFWKSPYFSLKEARSLFNKGKRFKKNGLWIGKNVEYFTLPAVRIKWGSRYCCNSFRIKSAKKIPIKSWLKFFGFWLAEGWINKWTNKRKNSTYSICLTNRDNALLSEMKSILRSFGYNVYWDKKVNHTIRIRDYQLFCYLQQFGKCHNKFVPLEIKSLSKELLEILFEYYIKGDGHRYGRKNKGLSATTSSTRLRDDLQEIALKIGMSAYYKLDHKKGIPFLDPRNNKIYKRRENTWTVYFIRHNVHSVSFSEIKKHNYIESWVDFEGKVYSLAVPNHVIYIRRNGIPVWCGNSDPPMNWRLSALDKITLISNSDAHSPQKLGREANIFEGNSLNYYEISQAIKNGGKSSGNLKLTSTVEFFPEEGKYHHDGHRFCKINLSPKETQAKEGICPNCGKPLTVGVLSRIEELANKKEGFKPKGAVPFRKIIPLTEIIAKALDKTVSSKTVENEYYRLINIGSEFDILLSIPCEEISRVSESVAKMIEKMRKGEVRVEPGFDGEYGKIDFSKEQENSKNEQKKLL